MCASAVCWPVVRGPGRDSFMLKVDDDEVVKLVKRAESGALSHRAAVSRASA
jgi:hypothetical protein